MKSKQSNSTPLEEQVVNKLIAAGFTISLAESCTGGLCTAQLVNVPNASRVLNASVVTYANEAKIRYLNVDAETIAKYGVVSEEVAAQMAVGAAQNNQADIGVGITGIAGPDGGTDTKPVGMVCFGICKRGKAVKSREETDMPEAQVYTYTQQFGNIGRQNVRKNSVSFVLETLLTLL